MAVEGFVVSAFEGTSALEAYDITDQIPTAEGNAYLARPANRGNFILQQVDISELRRRDVLFDIGKPHVRSDGPESDDVDFLDKANSFQHPKPPHPPATLVSDAFTASPSKATPASAFSSAPLENANYRTDIGPPAAQGMTYG